MRFCQVAGCQSKCWLSYCWLHRDANSKPQYSCSSRLLEYCGPAELARLTQYFPLYESPVEWRFLPGDIREVTFRNRRLTLTDDGSLKGTLWPPSEVQRLGKLRSLSTNDADLILLAEDYTFYWHHALRNPMTRHSLLPTRIIQVALQRHRAIYLTSNMELFSLSLT